MRPRDLRLPAFVAAAAVLVYLNALGNGFAFDDVFIVQNNPNVNSAAGWRAILLGSYWPGAPGLGLYRPISILAYGLEWRVGGGAPWVFHLGSLLLHATAAVLAFLLLQRFASSAAALLGALLFAVHPVRTEAVANIVGQAELIATVVILAACLIHVRRADTAVRLPRALALAALYALAIGAKETGVMLPALLVLLDFGSRRVRPQRASLTRYALGLAPLALLMAVVLTLYLAARHVALDGHLFGLNAAPWLPFLRGEHRLLNAFRAFPEYLRLLVWPLVLSADYSPAVIRPVSSFTAMTAWGLLLFLVTAALALLTPWRPRTGLPAGWFLLAILPVSNLIVPAGVVVAERTLYLPAFALSAAAAFAWDALPARAARRPLIAAAALVLLLFGARTILRNPEWRDTNTVWAVLLRDHPESYRAQWIHGALAANTGRLQEAERRYEMAHSLFADDPQFLYDYGNYRINRGQYDAALALARRSLAGQPEVPRAHVQLAFALVLNGRAAEALRQLETATRTTADSAAVASVRAQALEQLGRTDEAVAAWRIAVRNGGRNAWVHHVFLIHALAAAGRPADAARELQLLGDRVPDSPAAREALEQTAAALACVSPPCPDARRRLLSPWASLAK